MFNIFLGLGLPWMVKALQEGKAVVLPANEDVVQPVIILLGYLVFFMVVIWWVKWQLNATVAKTPGYRPRPPRGPTLHCSRWTTARWKCARYDFGARECRSLQVESLMTAVHHEKACWGRYFSHMAIRPITGVGECLKWIRAQFVSVIGDEAGVPRCEAHQSDKSIVAIDASW